MLKYCKLTPYTLKKIIRHFCVDIDASKTAILLSLNRNTINKYYTLFRQLIYAQRQRELRALSGAVEVDESYFGPRRPRGNDVVSKRGRGTHKQPVFGILERNGKVYTEIVPDCKKKTLQSIILGKVALETVIHSDGWRGYNGLVDVGYNKHFRVNHSQEYSLGRGQHINGIESFWSFTKRRLAKFNGVQRYFDLHLKECEWRWNRNERELEVELWNLLKNKC